MTLTTVRSTLIGVSSTAPLYSLAVTIDLITLRVGVYAPWALVLAAVPMLLVVRAMSILDARWPDQGTVYRWGRETLGHTAGLFGGWMLALTGVVVTASLGQVAAEGLLDAVGLRSPGAAAILGVVLLVILGALSSRGIEQGLAVQYATAGVQLVGAAAVLVALLRLPQAPPVPALPAAGPADWVHAVLLALFIYWGWDSTFALTEESHWGTAGRAASASMVVLVTLYAALAWAYASRGVQEFPHDPLIGIALFASALASAQNTVIPTSRGLMSMARAGDVAPRLRTLRASTWLTTALAAAYLVVMVAVGRGFFDDTVEALAFFIAGYYALACVGAVKASRTPLDRIACMLGALLMLTAGAVTLLTSFDPGYGATSFAGVGTVGIFAVAATVAFGALWWGWRRRQPRRAPGVST